jgi:hypothetical protein
VYIPFRGCKIQVCLEYSSKLDIVVKLELLTLNNSKLKLYYIGIVYANKVLLHYSDLEIQPTRKLALAACDAAASG